MRSLAGLVLRLAPGSAKAWLNGSCARAAQHARREEVCVEAAAHRKLFAAHVERPAHPGCSITEVRRRCPEAPAVDNAPWLVVPRV
jgi:hypothetical protein